TLPHRTRSLTPGGPSPRRRAMPLYARGAPSLAPATQIRGAGPLLSSAAVPPLYDLMLVLDPNAPEQSQNEVLESVESMIQSGGSLVGHHDWGVRRLAYEMDHRPEGAYHLFQFETGEPPVLERLDHSLKIADGVL